MSLLTRLDRLERSFGFESHAAGHADKPVLLFAIHVHLGKHWGLPAEYYWLWSEPDELPEHVAALGGCGQPADKLTRLAAEGYPVALLFDPAHHFAENAMPIVWPEYGPEHAIDWQGYAPGDCLRLANIEAALQAKP